MPAFPVLMYNWTMAKSIKDGEIEELKSRADIQEIVYRLCKP